MRGQLACVGVALLLLSGCGGDDAGGRSDEVASTDSAAPGTGTMGEESGDVPDDGSGDDSSAGDGDAGFGATDIELDVCGMLPPSEVATVIGADPGPGTTDDFPPFFTCDFDTPVSLISVTVLVWSSEDEARASMRLGDDDEYPDVEGIGDEAYDAAPASGLMVRSGLFEISVNVIGEFDSHEDLDQERQLAQMIIDRLP